MGFMRADMKHDAKIYDHTFQGEATALSILKFNINTQPKTQLKTISESSESSRGSSDCFRP